jgi:hypothetical protein
MKAILKEGGNVFDGTSDFDHAVIPQLTKSINLVLDNIKIKGFPIGSGATPTPGKKSGDLDVIVDQDAVMAALGTDKPLPTKKALEDLFKKAGFETKVIGINVHVKVPVGDQSHQVDLMLVPNSEVVSKFHIHDIPKGSPYKGLNKQLAMAKLAKEKDMKWSAFKGLLNRADDSIVSTDLDEIAKTLIGPNAGAKDLGSVESIVAALGTRGQQFLADLKADPAWKEYPQKETLADKHLNRIRELSGALLNHSSMSSGAFNR